MTRIPFNELRTGDIAIRKDGVILTLFYNEGWHFMSKSDVSRFNDYYSEYGKFFDRLGRDCDIASIYRNPSFKDGKIELGELIWDGSIDWSRVKVNTPIYVKSLISKEWVIRHFAFYKNGFVFTYKDGMTSFTVPNKETDVTAWVYAKLVEAESEDEHEQIKPCPFCGGDDLTRGTYKVNSADQVWYIECKSCGVRIDNFFASAKEAEDKWNRRV